VDASPGTILYGKRCKLTYDPEKFFEHPVTGQETLMGISLKYDVPISEIQRANRLGNSFQIFHLRTLLIPKKSTSIKATENLPNSPPQEQVPRDSSIGESEARSPRLGTGEKGPEGNSIIITSIVCGWSHSMIVVQTPSTSLLFTFGKNDKGQCGLGHTNTVLVPSLVKSLFGKSNFIVDVSAGYYHSCCLSENGEVYAWGFGGEGQLGNGFKQTQSLPQLVSVPGHVTNLFSGHFHNFAFNEDREMYVWGKLSTSMFMEPTLVQQFRNRNVLSVITGILCTIIVVETGGNEKESLSECSRISTDDSYWSSFSNEESYKQLKMNVRRGIPNSFREKVWPELSSANLLLAQKPSLYLDHIKAAFHCENISELRVNISILSDSFVDNFSFADHPLSEEQILQAQRILWTLRRTMHHILFLEVLLPDLVCMLLTCLSEEITYVVVQSLFEKEKNSSFSLFFPDLFSPTLLKLLSTHSPKLVSHLDGILDSEKSNFANRWWSRMFVNLFPYRTVKRLTDAILSEGLKVLVRVAIAVSLVNSSLLLQCQNVSEVMQTLSNYMQSCSSTEENSLLQVSFSISVKRENVMECFKEVRDSTLPNLDNVSSLAGPEELASLWLWLPLRFRSLEPRLVFCSNVDGFNLNTLLSKSVKYIPTILLIKSQEQKVFGVYVSSVWERNYEYRGTGEMFLFTLLPRISRYSWTKENSFFMRIDHASVMFGGGSACGLLLDDELHHGTSSHCETFHNMPLCAVENTSNNIAESSKTSEFICVSLEVIALKS